MGEELISCPKCAGMTEKEWIDKKGCCFWCDYENKKREEREKELKNEFNRKQ